jgi:hypothetical protein
MFLFIHGRDVDGQFFLCVFSPSLRKKYVVLNILECDFLRDGVEELTFTNNSIGDLARVEIDLDNYVAPNEIADHDAQVFLSDSYFPWIA